MLPYRKKEPTYSGSSTRFYEHLAACRPMVATRGFAELLEKPPLLELVNTAGEMQLALEQLRSVNFRDGLETARWEASRQGTWEARVRTLTATLARPSLTCRLRNDLRFWRKVRASSRTLSAEKNGTLAPFFESWLRMKR